MFHISHIPRERNERANTLAQQASRYEVRRELFMIKEKPMITLVDTICDNLAAVVGETRIAREARPTVEHDMGGTLVTSMSGAKKEGSQQGSIACGHEGLHTEVLESATKEDGASAYWRRHLIEYLRAPDSTTY
jgi:hypothetical protein